MFKRCGSWALACGLVLLSGCGDDSAAGGAGGESDGSGPGGASSGGSGPGGSSSGGSGPGGATSGGNGQGGAGPDCAALETAVNTALVGAKVCNPTTGALPCTEILEGLCCDVVVNPGNVDAVQAYQNALQFFIAAGCLANCPDEACADPVVGSCEGNTQEGSCVEQPG